jgi:CcmD family protein
MSFFETNSPYIVLAATLVIWFSLFIYLVKIEKRIKKTEQKILNK